MKNNNFLKLFLFLAVGIFTFTSCEDDGSGTGTGANGPTVTFGLGSGDDLTIAPGETFSITVNAQKGDANLKTVKITEGSTTVDLSRLKVNGTDASANPILILVDTEKTSLTYVIDIVAHSDVSTKVYAVEVTDENNRSKSVSLNVSTTATPPSLSYNGPASFNGAPGSLQSVKLTATKGGGKLATIAIYEGANLVTNLNGAEINGTSMTENPFTLPASLQDGFTDAMLVFRVGNLTAPTEYRVVVTDEFGGSSEATFTVNPGTPVETIMGALLNQAGPSGTGGLDLDTGEGTGSMNAAAEIRDQGIDLALPAASNWKQQISGVNGSSLKRITAGQDGVSENFTFDGVQTKEEVAALAGQGAAVTVSSKLSGGEVFAVTNNGRFYLIRIASVNVTVDNNNDQYNIDIKK